MPRIAAVLLLAALPVASACQGLEKRKAPGVPARVVATTVRFSDPGDGGTKATRAGVSKRWALVATAREEGGLFFFRPPLGLHGAWRTEATCGLFDDRWTDDVGDTIFGLEADLVGTASPPAEFYGVYARRYETPARGLQVFASSEDGNHGQVFLADATAADLAIETDGSTVTYQARDAALGGAWQTVAARTLQSPAAAHHPGFGMFGAPKGASVGFTNFRVPANGTPAAPPAPEVAALDDVYRAAFRVLEAAYRVDGSDVTDDDAAAADAFLADAAAALGDARTKIEALPPGKRAKTPVEKALAAVGKAEREVGKARKGLGKKGRKHARPFLRAVSTRMFGAAFVATDALLPDDVRATLPVGGLDW